MSEPSTYQDREYIIFPRPLPPSSDYKNKKDNLTIAADLVLILEQAWLNLSWILVDTESSADLLYLKTLDKLQLVPVDLIPNTNPLYRFSGE